MKNIFSIISGMLILSNAILFSQTSQIAFQGFEGSGSDTWGITAGSEKISTTAGSSDYPANQRIRTGIKSWQLSNMTDSLLLETKNIAEYDSVQLIIRLSSPATADNQGTEFTDSVNVFCSLDGTSFSPLSDITVTGFSTNNARWGYDAVLTAQTTTGNHALYSSPQTGTSTNNYSTIKISVPDEAASIALKIKAKTNNVAEFWCIDDISLTGVPAISGPTIYQPVSPQNFSTTTGVPDTNTVNVSFSSLVSGIYPSITGTHASLFTVIPDSVIASTPSPYGFRVIYLPDATGTHSATLTFSSAGATSRTVTLNGATLASEPAAQPTNLIFSAVTNTSFTVSYAAASGSPAGYISLRKTCSAPSSNPADGTSYSAGNTIGDATVAYVGSDVTFNQNGLSAGTTYYYKIYSYNGSGNGTNYLTVSPLSGFQITTGAGAEIIFPGVYGDSLLARLVASYKHNNPLGYDGARQKMYANIDNHNDTVTCVYTGYRIYIPYNSANASSLAGAQSVNCEHTYPQSKFNEASQPRCDLYHLYPTFEDANNARGSNPFNEIPDQLTAKWWRGTTYITTIPTSNIDEYSESTSTEFEPREDHKGNVARSMFYLYTMYKSDCDNADPSFFGPQKDILRQWHYQDPADTAEQTRNNAVASYQGKKNPFILDSTLVRRAYFPAVIGIGEDQNETPADFTLYQNYPNPFNPSTTITFDLRKSQYTELKIFNTLGQEVKTLCIGFLAANTYRLSWNGKDSNERPVSSGVYLYRLKTGNQSVIKKLLLLK